MSGAPVDGVYTFEASGLRYTGGYLNGRKNGIWRVFIVNDGSLRFEISFQDGEWNGPSTVWAGERKTQEGHYARGKLAGEWKFRFDTGQLAAQGRYEDDRKIGAWSYFDEAGSPMSYPEWSKEFAHWDWAYDDYSGFPRGENWPDPPPGAVPVPEGSPAS
jgi:hypothetical protein